MDAGGGLRLAEAAVLLLVAGAMAAAAWRASRHARRAAEASAAQLRTLHEELRRAIHELNNALAAAAIHAELLRHACPEDENARRLAESIQDQIQRAKDAVASLNNLGRPAA